MALDYTGQNYSFLWIGPTVEENSQMNQFIVDTYPSTKDAVLIKKYFCSELQSRFNQFLVKGREAELLELANTLEAEKKQ